LTAASEASSAFALINGARIETSPDASDFPAVFRLIT
jgi:hypothetical protein